MRLLDLFQIHELFYGKIRMDLESMQTKDKSKVRMAVVDQLIDEYILLRHISLEETTKKEKRYGYWFNAFGNYSIYHWVLNPHQ
jgi:hypothetical protein